MKKYLPVIAILLTALLSMPASSQALYLEKLGSSKKYGCSTAGEVYKVLKRKKEQRLLDGAAVSKLLRKLKRQMAGGVSDKKRRNLRRLRKGIKKCRKGTLTFSKACSAVETTSEGTVNPRIVDGRFCNFDDSFMVEIYTDFPGGGEGHCTGAFFAGKGIITAAHCLMNASRVTATQARIRSTAGNFVATDFVIHGEYNRSSDQAVWDMALIILDDYVAGVPKAPLLSSGGARASETAVIAGFGKDEDGVSGGDLLAGYVTIDSVGTSSIKSVFKRNPGESTVCLGDSGGPILVNRNGNYKIAGVTSYGQSENCLASTAEFYSNGQSYYHQHCFFYDTFCFDDTLEGDTCPFTCPDLAQ